MDDRPGRARIEWDSEERFRSLGKGLGVSAFGVNQMVFAPGQRMRIHRHRLQEEIYLVLEGRLEVLAEGASHVVSAGELLAVAPGVRRQLVNPFRERVVLVALGSAGEYEVRDAEAFTDWEATTGGSPRDVPLPDDLPGSELRD